MNQQPPLPPANEKRKSKKKLVWGLICLIGPSALIVLAIFLFAVVNFITGATSTGSTDAGLPGDSHPATVIANIALFIIGAISVVTLVPGIIVGIILLATRK